FQNADDKLFTENETNFQKLFGRPNKSEFLKDAFHDAIIENKNLDALRGKAEGTKFSPVYRLTVEGGQSEIIYLRLVNQPVTNPFDIAETTFDLRKKEADEFYQSLFPEDISAEMANIKRQAFAGLLWNKQYYHYDVQRWLNNSDGITPVSESRKEGRNHQWVLLKNRDIISMPDNWEYPWYAAWDSAFHAISMAIIDPVFAKNQLLLLMREWYMNPEGQLPAYEWNFNDVNPPVHAYAALQIYFTEKETTGKADIIFLKKIFQKLIINFTWWTNRKDARENNIFEGGFLGLDNIGVFNRSGQLPEEVLLEQTDGTSWMGMYALNMLDIALEIAMNDDAFEDAATKFYEHFVIIAEALNELGLWNEEDRFFYDVLALKDNTFLPLKLRSIVGLIPLYAVSIIDKEKFDKLKDFKRRTDWLKNYRNNHGQYLPSEQKSDDNTTLLSLVHKEKLIQLLKRFLDEKEFLSDGGIRSLSRYYLQNPYSLRIENNEFTIHYDPGDSTSSLFGGNSNWRGPVWMPINYLFIRALKKYGEFYGETVKVDYPSGSGNFLNLNEIADELAGRLSRIFQKDENGNRPVFGDYNWFYQKEENKELVLFHEYFHGDSARGLGASHQTGWTALVTDLI
ncbi:MAG TPA: glucosidase, partial [Flavisolibacter sp.]